MSDQDAPEETTSASRFGTETTADTETAVSAAALAIQRGELIVLPTDTVYGIGADAFDPAAVRDLLAAKGRGREMPPPVLVASREAMNAITDQVPEWVHTLTHEHWPGALTVVCRQQPSLTWDLGQTRGTVAVRMPDHPVALSILERTGPLAVSSANLTGEPAAETADDAEQMLAAKVAVIVDAGPSLGGVPSTIIDATSGTPKLLRLGALSVAELNQTLADAGVSIDA